MRDEATARKASKVPGATAESSDLKDAWRVRSGRRVSSAWFGGNSLISFPWRVRVKKIRRKKLLDGLIAERAMTGKLRRAWAVIEGACATA